MEENLNQQKQPARYVSQSDAGGSVSEPPAPSVTIRTMESDIKAIEQGGGEIIAPQPFTPEGVKLEEPKIEAQLGVPGYTGPEKPIFTSTAAISSASTSTKKSAKWKIIGIIIAILIIIIGLGLLGYFVISPLLFPKQMPAVQ